MVQTLAGLLVQYWIGCLVFGCALGGVALLAMVLEDC
jgi:hypothetical protein